MSIAYEQTDICRRQAFEGIYKRGGWPGSTETVSGRGSEVAATEMLRADLQHWLDRHPDVSVFLDAPCGDYNWIRYIKFGDCVRYIGGDIVEGLIKNLQIRYEAARTSFLHLDIVADDLPSCDAWFCRDVLIHLPLNDGVRVVQRFRGSGIKYFLSTTFPAADNIRDINYGEVRAVNLEIAPFSLGKPIEMLRDPDPAQLKAEPRRIRKYIGIWANDRG